MPKTIEPRNFVAKHAKMNRAAKHADKRRKTGRNAKHKSLDVASKVAL